MLVRRLHSMTGGSGEIAELPLGLTYRDGSLRCRIALLEANPEKLRGVDKNDEKYTQLVQSVRKQGVLQAIQITPAPANGSPEPKFWVVNGFQRFSVCGDLALEDIPVTLSHIDSNSDLRRKQVGANAHVIPTKRVEYAACIAKEFAENPSLTVKQYAEEIGMSPKWVEDQLQLNKLNDSIKPLVDEGAMAVNNAIMLSRLPEEEQDAFLQQAQTLPVGEFVPLVQAQLDAIRKAAKTGKAAEPPKFEAKPYPREQKELEAAKVNPTELLNQLRSNGVMADQTTVVAMLDWALHMDPTSIRQQEELFYKRLADKQAEKLKVQKEKIDKQQAAFKEQQAILADAAQKGGVAVPTI